MDTTIDTPEINHLYSCSRWAGRDAQQVIDDFIKSETDAYERMKKETAIVEEDIEYGDGGNQKVDMWGPTGDHIFVFIHGGYWQEGDRKYCLSPALSIVARGRSFASVGYELASGQRPLSNTVQDAVEAVQMLLAKYPTATFTVAGHSAGAQLAFKVAARLRNPRLVRLLLFAGVYQLEELVTCEIGRVIGLTKEEAAVNSCSADELSGLDLDILMLIGDMDAPPLKQQNELMAMELGRVPGIRVQLKKLTGVDHYSLISGLSDASKTQTEEMLRFEKMI